MKNHKRSSIVSLITVFTLVFSMCLGILATSGAQAQQDGANAETKNPAIAHYTYNLTKLARQGAFDVVAGSESKVDSTIQILSSSKQNNPVLIGEDENQSKLVVQQLARRIATGEMPEGLRETRLFSLNQDALLNGVKAPAELDARLKELLAEISRTLTEIQFYSSVRCISLLVSMPNRWFPRR